MPTVNLQNHREPLLSHRSYGVPTKKKQPISPVTRIIRGFGVSSIIGIIILIVLLAIPITLLAIGVHYRDPRYCPIEPRISLFLIVNGSVGIGCLIISIIFSIIIVLLSRQKSNIVPILAWISSIFFYVHILFIWTWLIIGGIWTFRVKKDVTHQYDEIEHFYMYNYCHPVLYRFTFVYLIIAYVLSTLGCVARWIVLSLQSN